MSYPQNPSGSEGQSEGGYGSSSSQGGDYGQSGQQGGYGSSSSQGGDYGQSGQQGDYGSSQQGGYGQSGQQGGYGASGGQPPAYGSQPPSYGGGGGQPPSYGGYGQPPYGGEPSPYGSSSPSDKSFFAKLFDFSFSSYVTPSIVKIVYAIVLVVIVLAWLVYTIVGFSQSAGLGIAFLIGGAIVALLYTIFARITLEFYIAVIRIAQDVSDLRSDRMGAR